MCPGRDWETFFDILAGFPKSFRIAVVSLTLGLAYFIILLTTEYLYLQGRVKFPIGGKVRERENAGLDKSSSQDLVQFQNQQYSLDGRR